VTLACGHAGKIWRGGDSPLRTHSPGAWRSASHLDERRGNGTRRGFVRRSALGAGALMLGNSLLAACGGGKEGAKMAAGDSSAAAAPAGSGKTLRISNWPLYIDKQTIPDFQDATGVTVKYIEDVNDNAEFFGKVQPQLDQGESGGRSIFLFMSIRTTIDAL